MFERAASYPANDGTHSGPHLSRHSNAGFEALKSLPEGVQPTVIVLTAFDEYALAAFDVQALDYVLKPIDDVRFFTALDRARRMISLKRRDIAQSFASAESNASEAAIDLLPVKRFTVRVGKELVFIESDTIDWIEAAGDYAELHVALKTYLIRQSLSTLENMLDREDFFRVHRSTIIRLDRIIRISALANRDGSVTLRDGVSLRVSRS